VLKKICFVSVSGGKDSTLTLALALEKYRNTDVPVVPTFCDTGWEHPATYDYLEELERFFGIRIYRIKGVEGGLPALIRKKKIFPSPKRRFCTELLKTLPQRKFYEKFYFDFPFEIAELWIGIRREESISRRKTKDFILPAGERDKYWGSYPFTIHFHYPIKDLTTYQVFSELKKRGIPINPLYLNNFSRVGCYPCLLAEREIIQVIVEALNGDRFSENRLEEMKELDETVKGRFNINYSLKELIERAKQKAKALEMPFLFEEMRVFRIEPKPY